MLLGKMSSHEGSAFFYLPFGGKLEIIEPEIGEEKPKILLEELDKPIHGFYL